MKRTGILRTVTLALLVAQCGSAVAADPQTPPAQFAEDVKTMLERNVGRVVTLHLTTGQELAGTVLYVGDHAVQLSKLAGRDYYDAVVLLDRVDAVLFKVWGK